MKNLTRDQEQFLGELTQRMTTQNNRATAYPLYYVYDKEEISVGDTVDSDRVVLRDEDWSEVEEFTDEEGQVWKFDKEQMWTNQDTGEEITSFELQDNYARDLAIEYLRKVSKPITNVGPFLTEQEAQAHIDANSYHYNEPYIFVHSCWRNSELQQVIRILFTLTGKEVPSWYT